MQGMSWCLSAMYESLTTEGLVRCIQRVQENDWYQFVYWQRRYQTLLDSLQERSVYVTY